MTQHRTESARSRESVLKVLGLSGSLRAASFSTALLEALDREGLPNLSLSLKTLGDIPLYNEDLDTYPALPTVARLRADVAASDGVVIATPEYNHGLPGVLKNALDWASRPAFESCFRGKPVLIITSAPGNTGGVRAQYQLRETLISTQAHIVPGREIALANIADRIRDGRFADQETPRVLARGLSTLREEILSREQRRSS